LVTQNAIPLQRVREFVYPKDSITRTKAIIPDFTTKHKLFTSNFVIKSEQILISIYYRYWDRNLFTWLTHYLHIKLLFLFKADIELIFIFVLFIIHIKMNLKRPVFGLMLTRISISNESLYDKIVLKSVIGLSDSALNFKADLKF
jgi:hypothetical protein